jgi:prolyl oligopeptidase
MKHSLFFLTAIISMNVIAQSTGAFNGKYPTTKTVEQTDDFFGTKVPDPYRWLENDTAADYKSMGDRRE